MKFIVNFMVCFLLPAIKCAQKNCVVSCIYEYGEILRSHHRTGVDVDKFVCFVINVVSVLINVCLLL